MEEAEALHDVTRATTLPDVARLTKGAWMAVAEKIYESKSNDRFSNVTHTRGIFEENEEMFAPLLDRCPSFAIILSFILENKFGFRVKDVDLTLHMTDWGEEECKRVGRSLATFIRKRKTGETAVVSWKVHYVKLSVLFDEVVGFEEFMIVIANSLLRDSIYGTVLRVSVGAALSMVDAVTDIYVIRKYYQSEELYGQANAMLAMLLGNISVQLLTVFGQYRGNNKKIKEAVITILLLRPAVDAYRVSTNHEDKDTTINQLSEMTMHKCVELAFESVPGCVLQLYVLLKNPEIAGTFALVSIGISCLTTGFTSAMVAFDFDVDAPHRKNQPHFYGYIPNENGLRGRCFVLMTLISSLHNLSRSLGCALLIASDRDNLFLIFLCGEIGLFFLYKIVRRDFYWWPRLSGVLAILGSLISRVVTKVIVDFSGCIHFRHPFELGGIGFLLSMFWAQVFPFISLQYFDGEEKENITGIFAVNASLWLLMNIAFFCMIDKRYLDTFFGAKTAPQYTIEYFLTSKYDFQKFDAIFDNRIEYSKEIHEEVKEWVAANIGTWKRKKPDWFKIEKIPNNLLPKDVLEAEGGAKRRRSSVSLREIAGLREASVGRVHPQAVEDVKMDDL